MMHALPLFTHYAKSPDTQTLCVVADWLLDNGRAGDAALVRCAWRADTWRAYRVEEHYGCILSVSIPQYARFLAACALAVNGELATYRHNEKEDFDLLLNKETLDHELVFTDKYGSQRRLDIEYAIALYFDLAKDPRNVSMVNSEFPTPIVHYSRTSYGWVREPITWHIRREVE